MIPWLLLLGCAILLPMGTATAADASRRPVVLHTLPVRGSPTHDPYAKALLALGDRFDIRPLRTPDDLAAVQPPAAIWLNFPNPSDPGTPADEPTPALTADVLLTWVSRGGGLVVMTERPPTGEGPRLARDLLRRLEIAQSPRRTGPKSLRIPDSHPFLGGLTWFTSGFTLLDAPESSSLQRPVLLPNDLAQRPRGPNAPDFAGYAMICGDYAEGRIALLADARWPQNPPVGPASPTPEPTRDHDAMLRRLFHWASRTTAPEPPPIPVDHPDSPP